MATFAAMAAITVAVAIAAALAVEVRRLRRELAELNEQLDAHDTDNAILLGLLAEAMRRHPSGG